MLIPLLGLFNYVIDPYGFNKMILMKNINLIKEDNTGYTIKYKMPNLRNGNWDNIMLGTSRIGLMDTKVVNKYLGGKTFTMSQPGSAIPIQYDSFLYAIKFNNVKNVVYGIDFMSFNKNIKLNNDYVQFKEELQSFGRFYTFDMYFNIGKVKKSIDTILNNSSNHSRYGAMYSENGERHFYQYKQRLREGTFDLQRSIDKHIKWYFSKVGNYYNYEYSSKYMQQFKRIVDYCNNNSIKLYVYIPPMYSKHFYAIKESGLKDEFEQFKKDLAKITDYIDFTGVNSITNNRNNYWDSSHLRKEHTELIMAKLFRSQNTYKHEDFGILITEDNVEDHLKSQSHQYKKINLKKILTTDYKRR